MVPVLSFFVATQVVVESPPVPPSTSSDWIADVGVSARSATSPPFLVVGGEQKLDDNLNVRAVLEAATILLPRSTIAAGAVLVGPRAVINPDDFVIASVYVLGGIGGRTGELSEPVDTDELMFRGLLRGGVALDVPIADLFALRFSSDVAAASIGWGLGARAAPKDVSSRVTFLFTPTIGIVFDDDDDE